MLPNREISRLSWSHPLSRIRILIAAALGVLLLGAAGASAQAWLIEKDSFELLAGTDSLLMRVDDGARRFRMSWGRGDGDDDRSEVLRYDAGTPAIRLDKADPKVCKPME